MTSIPPNTPFWNAYSERSDLKLYGKNSLLLFALQLRFQIEDVISLASSSLTAGGQDKKADLVHLDEEEGLAVIGQSYFSENFDKPEAKANKASDLNTDSLQTHAKELRRLIEDGKIEKIQVWYIHNLSESENVKQELTTVEHTLNSILTSKYPSLNIQSQAFEIGKNTLEEWYQSISTPILVTEQFKFKVPGSFRLKGLDWEACITSIPAEWIFENYRQYGTKLFSANFRDYLGSKKTDKNINEGIKKTANEDPNHFWVFNNGITAIVNSFSTGEDEVTISGISIINGAQTSGAIGNLEISPISALIPCRFIICNNPETVQQIVKFNNSQNKITASDYRSNDHIQKRLLKEFLSLPQIQYLPRRGSSESYIKRTPNALPSLTAGQTLAAFHREPDVAYHQKTKLWESDNLYSRFFNEQTTARHIVFAYSLIKSIQNKKLELIYSSQTRNLTSIEKSQLEFFRERGSVFMMAAAIADSLEIFLGVPIPNMFKVQFKKDLSPDQGTQIFIPIVNISSSFSETLKTGLSDGFRTSAVVVQSLNNFKSLLNSTKEINSPTYKAFLDEVKFN